MPRLLSCASLPGDPISDLISEDDSCNGLKKDPRALNELIQFGLSISAETVKACALIGQHMMFEEDALRLDNDSSLDLGDMCWYGCP